MKAAFGAIVSTVLLVIYVYLVWKAVDVVICSGSASCASPTPEDFNDRMASSMALIGGLVSALVIAELAATKPGEAPASRLLTAGQQTTFGRRSLKIVTGIYLGVWLLTGLTAFFYGYLSHPGVLPPLADLGQGWLGIAVGAGYAYFGIEQKV